MSTDNIASLGKQGGNSGATRSGASNDNDDILFSQPSPTSTRPFLRSRDEIDVTKLTQAIFRKRMGGGQKGSNKHSRTITAQASLDERKTNTEKYELVDRPRKHRYIFLVANKKIKKEIIKKMNYKPEPYPKGDNKNYDSGGDVSKQLLLL